MTSTTLEGMADAGAGRIKLATSLPTSPVDYYGDRIGHDEWRGGELIYHNGTGTGSDKLYLQSETSGKTAIWKVIATKFTTP